MWVLFLWETLLCKNLSWETHSMSVGAVVIPDDQDKEWACITICCCWNGHKKKHHWVLIHDVLIRYILLRWWLPFLCFFNSSKCPTAQKENLQCSKHCSWLWSILQCLSTDRKDTGPTVPGTFNEFYSFFVKLKLKVKKIKCCNYAYLIWWKIFQCLYKFLA